MYRKYFLKKISQLVKTVFFLISKCIIAVVFFNEYQLRQKAKEPRDALDIMIKRMEEKNVKNEDINKIKNIFNKFRDDASLAELKHGFVSKFDSQNEIIFILSIFKQDDMSYYIIIDIKDEAKCDYIFEPLLKFNPNARFYSYSCAYFA